MRNSLAFVSWQDRKAVAAALKGIYRAANAEMAEVALADFEASPLGREIPGHRPGLAASLARCRDVLRLRAGRTQVALHYVRDRGFECKAAPGGSRPRPFPER